MLRSLVGSEMCIRDSPDPAQVSGLEAVERKHAAATGAALKWAASSAVDLRPANPSLNPNPSPRPDPSPEVGTTTPAPEYLKRLEHQVTSAKKLSASQRRLAQAQKRLASIKFQGPSN
eukprot:TRINITY_DN2166_c0_g1_i4.p1 TRINITY_DN2166_c0_g1~~TRINITY_DN2166_c0_g1_i4.p1  ORF type:complete len:118 (+),score=43.06 TRINITY_DN2166_c0_g1_i4:160-513(+)